MNLEHRTLTSKRILNKLENIQRKAFRFKKKSCITSDDEYDESEGKRLLIMVDNFTRYPEVEVISTLPAKVIHSKV